MNRVFVRAGENDYVNIVDLATKSEISGTGWCFTKWNKLFIINTQLQMKVLGKIYSMLCCMHITL